MRFKSYRTFEWRDPWDNDPSAPWNQPDDPDPIRDIDWIDGPEAKKLNKFELLASDFSEIGILREIESGIFYVIYIDGEEINDYRQKVIVSRSYDGDGGYDDETENLEIDDKAIMALASDTLDSSKDLGVGLEDWEKGKNLCVLDISLLEEISSMWKNDQTIVKALEEIREKVLRQRGRISGKKFGF